MGRYSPKEFIVMFRTSISTTDPNTGNSLPVPKELVSRVTRAGEILEGELGELAEKFSIDANWRFVPEPTGKFGVKFDLTTKNLTGTQNVGLFNSSLPLDALQDDESILRSLRKPMVDFGRTLSGVLKEELDRIRRDLQTLATVTGE
jgi:hypothetical protein